MATQLAKPTAKKDIIVISDDNPYKEVITHALSKVSPTSTENRVVVGRTRVTIEQEYLGFNGAWIKFYKNKEALLSLSPNACKILIYIALNMQWNQERIQIRQQESGLSRRRYPGAITELIRNNIIRKDKQNWYWVNLTILIYGRMEQLSESST